MSTATSEKLTDPISEITIDEEKRKRIRNLFKSFCEIDNAIEPFREQRRDLRNSYIENDWLTNDEFSLAKKAYTALKSNINLDDVQIFIEIGKEGFPKND